MESISVQRIDDIPPYTGPNQIPGIRFRAARTALGVTAWGMNVLDLDPGCDGYPEHDHAADGQEEVYIVLAGDAVLRAGETTYQLGPGDMARVPPAIVRKLVPGSDGVRILALGGTPGIAYGASVATAR